MEINSDWHFNANVTQLGSKSHMRLSIQQVELKFNVTPDAIEGNSEELLAVVKRAALGEDSARRLTEAITEAARDSQTLMPRIVLDINKEQLNALGFETHG
jgi:hypothetical protein